MHCFFRLLSEHPNLDVNLVLAGSRRFIAGEMFEPYQQFNSRIIYTGYIADEDLSALYSGATAFIFPSLYEGFGLPPLEAMSCGTPVISSNRTSLPEVVGDAGIMVDPKDEDELCQAMLNLLKDNNLVQELREKGFERSKNFSWTKCTADTVDVYKSVLRS
jgi:glycosyltransferase involved in cell wall biosynthesis